MVQSSIEKISGWQLVRISLFKWVGNQKGLRVCLCCMYLFFRCHKQWGKRCGLSKYVYLILLSPITGKPRKSAVVLIVKGKK